jgi:hypothetical protein
MAKARGSSKALSATRVAWIAGLASAGALVIGGAVYLSERKSAASTPSPGPVTSPNPTTPAPSPPPNTGGKPPVATQTMLTKYHRYTVVVFCSAPLTKLPSATLIQTMLGSNYDLVTSLVTQPSASSVQYVFDYAGPTGNVPISNLASAVGSAMPANATWTVSVTDNGLSPGVVGAISKQ